MSLRDRMDRVATSYVATVEEHFGMSIDAFISLPEQVREEKADAFARVLHETVTSKGSVGFHPTWRLRSLINDLDAAVWAYANDYSSSLDQCRRDLYRMYHYTLRDGRLFAQRPATASGEGFSAVA